jgi:hypothetical protein
MKTLTFRHGVFWEMSVALLPNGMPDSRGESQKRNPRYQQLSALARDPNEDTAEIALADLWHEFPPT